MPFATDPVPELGRASAPGRAFFGLLGALVLTGCAALPAALLYGADWPAADALRRAYHWQPVPAYTQADWETLRRGLAGLAGAGLLLLGGWGAGRREARALGRALAAAVRGGLRAGWYAQAGPQRRGAAAALLALTLLRLALSRYLEPYDDAISYEVFVQAGSLTTAAVYPMPNNHVGTNLLSGVFYGLHPGFWWTMRLPVVLTATLATAGWWLGLRRWGVGYGVALGAVGWFGLSQLALYHAAQGRGYWALVGLSGLVFFSVLTLTAAPSPAGRPGAAAGLGAATAPAGDPRRAAWATLLVSGVLGLYVVPSFGYVLFSAYSWLGWQHLRRAARGAGALAAPALGLGLLTLLGAALLYSPLLLVSGPARLLANEYVQARAAADFWPALPRFVWETEGWTLGHRWLGLVPALLGLAAWRLGRRRRWLGGQSPGGTLAPPPAAALPPAPEPAPAAGPVGWGGGTPAAPPAPLAHLARTAAWFALTPYALLLSQRVLAPERTLFYKGQFTLLLLALLAAAWARRWAAPARRRGAGLLAGATLLYGAFNLGMVERGNTQRRLDWGPYRAAAHWLAARPAAGGAPVRVADYQQRVLLRFFTHEQAPRRPAPFDVEPRPAGRYRYQVTRPGAAPPAAGPGQPPPRPVLRNARLTVWLLAPGP